MSSNPSTPATGHETDRQGLSPAEKVEKDRAMRKAYGAATQDLREAHRDEFNSLYSKRAKEAGYEWEPSLTPREKAALQIRELLIQFPDLTPDEVEVGP